MLGKVHGRRQRVPCPGLSRTGRGAGEKFLDDTQVPLPNDGNAIKDSHEENALRENAGGDEIQVRDGASWQRPSPSKDLAKEAEAKAPVEWPG